LENKCIRQQRSRKDSAFVRGGGAAVGKTSMVSKEKDNRGALPANLGRAVCARLRESVTLGIVLCAGALLPLVGCHNADRVSAVPDSQPTEVEQNAGLQQKWGIQIQGIWLSAADYMLDFRYRIVDPNVAAPLLDRSLKPYLVDQTTGARLIVPAPPKVGALRQSSYQPNAGRTYFIIFGNPGRLVKRGGMVTVVIGDFRAENLVVE
jgi:hypothetical protein